MLSIKRSIPKSLLSLSQRRCSSAFDCYGTICTMGTATTGEDEVMILRGCEGAYGMRDDVICCIPSRGRGNRAINRDVVFIPGDIQDLEEDMEKEPSAKPFKQMSLERTAALLCQRYNHNANIFVIRPTRKRGTFSEFDNFLVAGKSAMHLIALLASAKRRLGSTNSNNNSIISTTDTELLCFSKGCIVMNQILADLAAAVCSSNNNVSSSDDDLQFFDTDDPAMKNAIPPYYLVNVQVQQQRDDVDENEATMRYLRSHRDRILSFFDTVSAVHWIDGHRFITSKRILRCLAEYLKQRNTNAVSRSEEEAEEGRRQRRGKGLRFFLHSTPYELDDPEMRPQVRPELNAFREGLLLSSFLKSDEKQQQQQQQEQWVKFYSYFEGEPRSIYQHFHLLSIFALPTTSSQP